MSAWSLEARERRRVYYAEQLGSLRTRETPEPRTLRQVERLRLKGMSLTGIGDELGLRKNQVAGMIHRHLPHLKHRFNQEFIKGLQPGYVPPPEKPKRDRRKRPKQTLEPLASLPSPSEPSGPSAPPQITETPAVVADVQRSKPAGTPATLPVSAGPLLLIQRWTHCQFPHGDPKAKDFHLCGLKVTHPTSPYCPKHHRDCYRPHGSPRDP